MKPVRVTRCRVQVVASKLGLGLGYPKPYNTEKKTRTSSKGCHVLLLLRQLGSNNVEATTWKMGGGGGGAGRT